MEPYGEHFKNTPIRAKVCKRVQLPSNIYSNFRAYPEVVLDKRRCMF